MKAWQSLVLVSSLVLLAGCGGAGDGGGNAGNPVNNNPQPLSMLAGNMGGSGNVDGTATVASFAGAQGLVFDGAGNLYAADAANDSIRKIAPDGTVSTLVQAPLGMNQPAALAIDSSGNLYVFDVGTNVVAKIAPDGSATQLAKLSLGYVNGLLIVPGMTVDAAGNVIVADLGNAIILKITPTGTVSTLAGSPVANNTTPIDGTGAAARFVHPSSLVADRLGNVYVADYNTLRMITPAGVVSTVAGSAANFSSIDGTGAAAAFGFLSNLAIDGAGNLYAIDNSGMRKITPAGVVTSLFSVNFGTTIHSVTDFYNYSDTLAIDASGNFYMSATTLIRKLNPAGVASVFAGSSPVSGSAEGTGAAAGFFNPRGLAVDANGNVIVADPGNSTIRKIDSKGNVSTLAGSAGVEGCVDGTGAAAVLAFPTGVALDGSGNIYVSDGADLNVRAIAPGGAVTTLAGACSGRFSTTQLHSKRRIQAGITFTGGYVTLLNGTGAAATFGGPSGIAYAAGKVYLADFESSQIAAIREITTPGGVTSTLAGTMGLTIYGIGQIPPVLLNGPSGVAVDAAGNTYVCDMLNHVVDKITPDGTISVFAGTLGAPGNTDGTGVAASFSGPTGLAIDSDGNLYVADTGNNLIRKVTPARVVNTVVGTKGKFGFLPGALPGVLSAPRGVAVSGNLLYISMANGVAVVQNRP